MRSSRIGTLLLTTGFVVGVGAAAAWFVGIKIVVPPEVVTLMAYKLAFGGAAGLLIAGAVVRRYGLLGRTGRAEDPSVGAGEADTRALGEGSEVDD